MLTPHYVEKGTLTIAGAAASGQPGEFNYANIWENQYKPIEPLIKPYSLDGGSYGVTLTEGNHQIYLAGVAVSELAGLPKGVEKRQIPPAKYAVFGCLLSTMAATQQEIYGQWFYASDKEPDNQAPAFEYYPPQSPEDEMRVEIYIPVKLKETLGNEPKKDSATLFDLINQRRSIRKFKDIPIAEDDLRKILQAGILAPSGKNRQPWKFYVIQGEKRSEMIAHMQAGISRRESQNENTGSAKYTLKAMEQAPVTLFIFNPYRTTAPWLAQTDGQSFSDLVDIQSVGAAIQNMLLATEALGLGSLWICDVLFAQEELSAWLGETSQMIAAVSLGTADEHPVARSRRPLEEVAHWV